ncbi:MAG TPA: hypothetical protein VJL29_14300 [Thermoguttaceae bacterium]|nr:hypothetical protein [Thermoguttaceae bacterium]
MSWKTCWSVFAVAGLLLAVAGRPAAAADPPKWDDVKKAVMAYFERLPDYKRGDLLSRSQVEPVFGALERLGWRVAARKALVESVLPDNDPLVQQLRTPAGRKFARQVAGVPDGYDRLDRLRRLPRGRQNVENLIRGPDGYLMIEYMTTTPGGRNLGGMLSRAPKGKGFNQSTGRIYTVDMLLERLKQEYAKAFAIQKQAARGST